MAKAFSTTTDDEFRHDAFISYSRKDQVFVAMLERTLRGYRPPAGLDAPQRRLNIFRDTEDFTGTEYTQSVSLHLKDSRKLVVVCSPDARRSEYVNDEIRIFVATHGAKDVIPLLVRGIPNNEAKSNDDPEMAFPAALVERLQIPLACDYRGFDLKAYKWASIKKYEQAWFQLLANIFDCSRDEIDQREQRRQRQQRVRWMSAAAIVGSLLLSAGGIALFQRQKAVTAQALADLERKTAESERFGAQSMQQADKDPNEALRLALAAVDHHETELSVSALRLALAKAPDLLVPIKMPGRRDGDNDIDPPKFSFSPDGRRLAIAEPLPRIVDASTGETAVELSEEMIDAADVRFSKNSAFLAVVDAKHATKVFDANSGKIVAKFPGELFWRTSPVGTEEAAVMRESSVEIGAFDSSGRWRALRDIVPKNYKNPSSDPADLSFSQIISPDGHKIASLQENDKGSILVVTDLETGQKHSRRLAGPTEIVFSPTGALLAAYSLGGVFVIETTSLKTLFEHNTEHENMLDDVTFSSDEQLIALNMRDQAVVVWSIARRAQVATFSSPERVFNTAFSPGGDFIGVHYGVTNHVELYPVDKNANESKGEISIEAVASLDPIWGGARAMQFTPDGRALVIAYESGVLASWDMGRWRAIHRLPIEFDPRYEAGKPLGLRDVKMTADAREIGVQDKQVWHGWSIDTGVRVPDSKSNLEPIDAMALLEHGDYALQEGENNNAIVFLLHRSTGMRQYPMSHSAPVSSMGFSANGNCVLTSSAFFAADVDSPPHANVARLWDTTTGALLQEWRFPSGNPAASLFSGNDRVVALSEGAAFVFETRLCADLDTLRRQALARTRATVDESSMRTN